MDDFRSAANEALSAINELVSDDPEIQHIQALALRALNAGAHGKEVKEEELISEFLEHYTYSVETDCKSVRSFAELRWTTEAPVELGLYRARHKIGFCAWVEVGSLDDKEACVIGFLNKPGVTYIHDFTHWLGPLPVPEMPR